MASHFPSNYNPQTSQSSQPPSFLSLGFSSTSQSSFSRYSFSHPLSSSSQSSQSAPHFSDRNLFEIIKRNLNRSHDPKEASDFLNEKTIEFLSKKQFSNFKYQLENYAQARPECQSMLADVLKTLFWSHQRALSTTGQWTLNKTFQLLSESPSKKSSEIANDHPHLLPFLRNYTYEEIQEALQEFFFDQPDNPELYGAVYQLYRLALESGPIWHIAAQMEGIDLSQPAGLTIEECLAITNPATWQQHHFAGENWADIYTRIKTLITAKSSVSFGLEMNKLQRLGADLSCLQKVLDLQTTLEDGPSLLEQLSFLTDNSFLQDETTYLFAKCRNALATLKAQMRELIHFPVQELLKLLSSKIKQSNALMHEARPKKSLSHVDQFLDDYRELIYHTSLAMMHQTLKCSLENDLWPADLKEAWSRTLKQYPEIDTNLILTCKDLKEIDTFLYTLWAEYTKDEPSLAEIDLIEILNKSIRQLNRNKFKKVCYQLRTGNPKSLVTILLEAFEPFRNLPTMKQWCLKHL